MKKSNMAKKALSLILVLSMLCGILAMLPLTAGAATAEEPTKGTQNDPIIVSNAAELKNLKETIEELAAEKRNPTLDIYYVELTADINFAGKAMPDLDLEAYSVHFEGGNYTVSNFTAEYGLFGALGENSTVQNLAIVGATIVAPGGGVGAIVGTALDGFAAINCSVDKTTTVKNNANGPTGGLVGQTREGQSNNNIYFTNCTNNATVTAAGGNLGGMIGQVANSYSHLLIDTCVNNGTLVGGAHTGGLVGSATDILKLRLNECENTADISTTGGYAGGLLGYAKCYTASTETWTVSYSKNTGNVSAPSFAGGIIGYAEGAPAYRVSYSANTGDVTTTATASGVSAAGGILGYQAQSNYARTSSFSYCYNEGKLTSANAGSAGAVVGTGGIVGSMDATGCSTVTIAYCYDFGQRAVTSGTYNYNGMIAGYLVGGTTMNVTNCKGTAKTNAAEITATSVSSTANSATVASKAEIADTMAELERNVMLRRPGGNGSKENPYTIGTAMQLAYFAKKLSFDNETYVQLTDNIDFGGYHLQVDFMDSREYKARVVHVNGGGYTISNYTSKTGIFERIGSGSTIENLHVSAATIINPADNNRHAGAIVGYAEGDLTMINCSADATVEVKNENADKVAGGLVGTVEGTSAAYYMLFSDCSSAATVTGNNIVGGVLGKIYSSDSQLVMMNCTNTGAVSTTSSPAKAGGVVGALEQATSVEFYTCKDFVANPLYGNVGEGVEVNEYTSDTFQLLSKSITQDFMIRLKLTDHFGLMAITEITKPGVLPAPGETVLDPYYSPIYGSIIYGPADGSEGEDTSVTTSANLDDYSYGFYFLESESRVTPQQLKTVGVKVEGSPYGDSSSAFYAAYTDMRVADIARNIHFMAYAEDSEGNEMFGAMRTVDVSAMIEDLADGKIGSQTVTKNQQEIDLYRSIYEYSETYDRYQYRDSTLNIGVLNLAQSNQDKTAITSKYLYTNSAPSNVEKNLDAFANTMYTLGLDVMGLNECDIYRGSASSFGGYHTPWEIAQRMEELTGEQYYWAFATALNEEAKDSSGNSVRAFYNRYAANQTEGPKDLYRSGDGLLGGSYATHSGYGEGLVSKYPIVSVEERVIDVAKYLEAHGSDAEKEYYKNYNESYQYDPATGYERRVILVATLDVNGSYVTVMVTHWDHKAYSVDGSSNEFTRVAAQLACMEAMEEYSDRPVFLMGDLNVGRHSSYIKALDKVANRAGDDNMTGTNPNSGEKIDHIYYNDYAKIAFYNVETRNEASDHYPVRITARMDSFGNPAVRDFMDKLYLSIEPTSAYPAGDGAQVLIYEGVTEAFFEEYTERLSQNGFLNYTSNEIISTPSSSYKSKGSDLNRNFFATYATGENSVDLQYHAYGYLDSVGWASGKTNFGNQFSGGILFVTVSPRSGLTLPLKAAPDYVAVDQTQYPTILTQVGLGEYHAGQASNCYLIRLADGTFIVHDSGYGADLSPKTTADAIYDLLCKQAPDPNNIVISAWITTHPHNDHMDGLLNFANKYSAYPNVTVKEFVHNFADDTIATANERGNHEAVREAIKQFPGATVVKPHAGNVLYYANVKFTILYTHENHLQLNGGTLYDGNASSMVMQMETETGTKVLFGADSPQMDNESGGKPFTFNAIAKRYGNALNSEVLVYFHHGLGGGSSWEANEAIAPKIVLWPVTHAKVDSTAGTNNDLMESSHALYFTRVKRYNIFGSNRFTEGVINSSKNHAGVYGYFIADDDIHIVELDKKNSNGVPNVISYETHAAYLNS